jgi:hypothetical protein
MRIEVTEVVRIEEHQTLSLAELADLSRLTEAELLELLECGVIAPVGSTAGHPAFAAECLVAARAATRLKEELDLDAHSVAVVLTLLERIRKLEAELRVRTPSP